MQPGAAAAARLSPAPGRAWAHSGAGRRALRAPAGAAGCAAGSEPGAGGGAWPAAARSQPLAFCAATLPDPFRAPRRPPPARSEPLLPRESLRLRFGAGLGGCWRCRLAAETQALRGAWAAAPLKEGGSVRAMPSGPGPVSAHGGGRAGTLGPRTWAARQRRARHGSRSAFHLPPTGLEKESGQTPICVPCWQNAVPAREPAGAQPLPPRLVPWGETGQVPLPWLGFAPGGCHPCPWWRSPPARVDGVPAHSWGACRWPGLVPSLLSSCGPTRSFRGTPGRPQGCVD